MLLKAHARTQIPPLIDKWSEIRRLKVRSGHWIRKAKLEAAEEREEENVVVLLAPALQLLL